MRRPQPTAESKARAERIARALAGMLDEPPPTVEPGLFGKARAERVRAYGTAIASGPAIAANSGALVCPGCAGAMHAVGMGQGVEVDQCIECGAVWFDAGELDALLTSEVADEEAPVTDLPALRRRMTGLVPGESQAAIRYRECPRCGDVMARRNFGTISGVVVDECPRHGVLLDEGELQALETFVRVGGKQLGEQVRADQGLRSVPPAPEPHARPGEVRTTGQSVVVEAATESLASTIWRLLFG
ncbi:MAG: zf-TFIIB domain-containing protein [Myxococcales bacterium]|nr:zf-TFIIB domain-containing protein [Myxococcales bacterium]